MKTVLKVEIVGDSLALRYRDDSEPDIENRMVVVSLAAHPTLQRLMKAFTEIVGTYLLTENKNLKDLSKEDMEDLFRKLLEEPPQGKQ